MASKTYAIRLTPEALNLVHESETLSSRMNQILTRYAWLMKVGQDVIRRAITPEAIAALAERWDRKHYKFTSLRLMRGIMSSLIEDDFPIDAKRIGHLHPDHVVPLLELVEAQHLDWEFGWDPAEKAGGETGAPPATHS